MTRLGLILAVTLLAPVLAQSCDVGTITLTDVTETLTVTNDSASQDAVVLVTFSDASSSFRLPAGASKTATVVGASDYRIEVLVPDLPAGNSYKDRLLQIRDDLISFAGSTGEPGVTLEDVLNQLVVVETALTQLHGSKTSQSCSHVTAPNGHNHATITWTTPGVSNIWVLSCA